MNEEQARAMIREELIKLIGNAYSAPIEFLQTIDVIARKQGFAKSVSSNKTVGSVTQAVAEGGLASYNVCKVPDGFFLIEGTNKNIPYWTS